jgi:hypothetical protein
MFMMVREIESDGGLGFFRAFLFLSCFFSTVSSFFFGTANYFVFFVFGRVEQIFDGIELCHGCQNFK